MNLQFREGINGEGIKEGVIGLLLVYLVRSINKINDEFTLDEFH